MMQISTHQILRVLNNSLKKIHSVPVLRLSNWECVNHVYLFLAEFLEEILGLHPILIFVS